MTFDDQDLIDYHNDALAAEKADALLKQLESDDVLAARLLALDPAREVVARTYASIETPDFELPGVAGGAMPWRALMASVAAAAAISLWAFFQPSTPDWHKQVADYQVLYTEQTISMITPSPEALNSQFQTLDDALSLGFDEATLTDIDGLKLLRAQLLGFEGDALGQIVFTDDQSRPIALCLMAKSGQAELSERDISGLNTVSWGDEDHQFLLVGPVSSDVLRGWAEAIRPKV